MALNLTRIYHAPSQTHQRSNFGVDCWYQPLGVTEELDDDLSEGYVYFTLFELLRQPLIIIYMVTKYIVPWVLFQLPDLQR